MMMMIQNKKASAFTPMIENRGSYNAKQKVPDGSSSRIPQGPHQSPQTTSNTPKSTEYFSVAKYMASMRQSGHSINTYNPMLVSVYLSWT